MAKIDLPGEKKVGHLTLLRESRAISPKEFNALSADERLAMIRGVGGRQKYELILQATDARELVQRLSVQEVYLLIRELGAVDVPELVGYASPEQFTSFIDLDCWDGDRLDGPRALEWLVLLLGEGEERVLETALNLDFELLVLIIHKLVTVASGPEDYLDEDARIEAMQQAGGYSLDYRDSESAKLVAAFLDILHRHDPAFYANLLNAVRWEQEAILEEEVLRLRTGRLEDLGFPDPFEAPRVYSYLDPVAFDPAPWRKRGFAPPEATEAPGFVLGSARPRGLLAEILAGGVESELVWELTFLLNQVMSANRTDVGDLEAVQQGMTEVFRYLDIALEYLSDGDLDRAILLFRTVTLPPLFRIGFSLTLDLQKRALDLAATPIGPYLDGPFRTLVDALCQPRPRFFEGISDLTRGGARAFENLREVQLAGEWLDRLAAQRRLFTDHFPFRLAVSGEVDLDGCAPDNAEDLSLSDFFLTALANRILGRTFAPEPLAVLELPVLHARVCRQGKVDPELRAETVRWLESLEPEAVPFGNFCLDIWEEEFCLLPAEDLEPRYLGGLIVRLES